MASKSAKNNPSGSPAKSAAPKKNSALTLAEKKAEQIVKSADKSGKPAKNGANAGKSGGIKQYFKDLRSEFKKVVWPSRKTVVNNTSVVLIAMVISAIFIWGIDSGFAALLNLLVNH